MEVRVEAGMGEGRNKYAGKTGGVVVGGGGGVGGAGGVGGVGGGRSKGGAGVKGFSPLAL